MVVKFYPYKKGCRINFSHSRGGGGVVAVEADTSFIATLKGGRQKSLLEVEEVLACLDGSLLF